MTREEFDYLKDVVESISARFKNAKTDFYGSAEIIMYEDECKTLESAISALSADPCENCKENDGECCRLLFDSAEGEYIKKEDVINAIANTCFWLSADNWDELIKAINGVKTYSFPDREKGEWIDHECDSEFYRCSKCHICWTKGEVDNCNMNFCPNCGADMRGKDNETDN